MIWTMKARFSALTQLNTPCSTITSNRGSRPSGSAAI